MIPYLFPLSRCDFGKGGLNTPMKGAVVLIHQFWKHIHVFQGIGGCEISVQFGFQCMNKYFRHTGFGISMCRKVMNSMWLYKLLKCTAVKFFSCIWGFLPWASFEILPKASVTSFPVFFLIGCANAYFEKASITTNMYRYPLFCLVMARTSIKSATHCLLVL